MIAEVGYGSKPVNTSSQSFSKDMYMIDGAITILGNNHLTFRGLRFI